jgi:hypothetical protein
MKTFESIDIDKAVLSTELHQLDAFLQANSTLKERERIAPFFKASKQLCAAS